MPTRRVIQGRAIGDTELTLIREVILGNPDWGRTRLSQALCQAWSWRATNGRLKDMACRTLLLKLERAGLIALPLPRRPANNALRNRRVRVVPHSTDPIDGPLQALLPLRTHLVEPGHVDFGLFNHLLQAYHYLGHRSSVGETLRYLVREAQGREVCCLLFGSAAWAVKPRDRHIGWKAWQRQDRLQWITNNRRFLILPWVRVHNLGSYVLSAICRRVREDWGARYGHPVWAVETFVDRSRFLGTCYQAANWLKVGQTSGRTRSGTRGEPLSTIKDVYLYGLIPEYRQALCSTAGHSQGALDAGAAGS